MVAGPFWGMTISRFIQFDGVEATLELLGAAAIPRMLREVMPGWGLREVEANAAPAPFFRISDLPERPGRYLSEDLIGVDAAPRRLDAMNAVCDMIAALSLALPDSDARLICLHAAAIEVDGRLVLIPNMRKAGKSTLSAALAARGKRVFSDDFVAVRRVAGSHVGRANGICPRLRLPLPDGLSAGFRDWAEKNEGPDNGQYKYLTLPNLPAAGVEAPIGAIVLLERVEDGDARLEPVDAQDAMDRLLKQNFTRDRHSAEVLALLSEMLATYPVQRMVYSEASDGARLLDSGMAFDDMPSAQQAAPDAPLFKANFGAFVSIPYLEDMTYRQRPGAALAEIGSALYLADPEGGGIHKLNPTSAAIWEVLEEPISSAEIAGLLKDAFPDADAAMISADVAGVMERFARAGLIAPAA